MTPGGADGARGGKGLGRPRTAVHGRAGLGRVRQDICFVREFSICLLGVGWEWGESGVVVG